MPLSDKEKKKKRKMPFVADVQKTAQPTIIKDREKARKLYEKRKRKGPGLAFRERSIKKGTRNLLCFPEEKKRGKCPNAAKWERGEKYRVPRRNVLGGEKERNKIFPPPQKKEIFFL